MSSIPLTQQITLDDLTIEVIRKPIRHLYLHVTRPHGQVRLSAPLRCSEALLRQTVIDKADWIRHHQARIAALPQTLQQATHNYSERRALHKQYRQHLQQAVPPLLEHWCGVMRTAPPTWHIKQMKTRWGTCNPRARRIWLALALAQVSHSCLEYVVVHELVHLFEGGHGERFKNLMDQWLPDWRERRRQLKGRL